MKTTLSLAIVLLASPVIAASGGDLKHPDWHPDGNRLVAEGNCLGGNDLYSIDLESGNVRMVWDGGATEAYPRWFSDGERIAFHQIDEERNARLFIGKLDRGGNVHDLRRLTDGPFDIEPAPSPAGQTIAFSHRGEDSLDIALLDVANRKVARDFATGAAENFPSWNADGTALIFHARGTDGTDIYRRDRRTGQLTRLTDGDGPNLVADLSNDGRFLAYASERSDDREIYVRNLDDGGDRRITWRAGRDGYPKFSPDGKQLAFHAVLDDRNAVVRVLDLATEFFVEFTCNNLATQDLERDAPSPMQ